MKGCLGVIALVVLCFVFFVIVDFDPLPESLRQSSVSQSASAPSNSQTPPKLPNSPPPPITRPPAEKSQPAPAKAPANRDEPALSPVDRMLVDRYRQLKRRDSLVLDVRSLSDGDVGHLRFPESGHVAEVLNVIDGDSCLVTGLGASLETVWLHGPTPNLVDGSKIDMGNILVRVIGRKQYQTAIGGLRTVWAVKVFNIERAEKAYDAEQRANLNEEVAKVSVILSDLRPRLASVNAALASLASTPAAKKAEATKTAKMYETVKDQPGRAGDTYAKAKMELYKLRDVPKEDVERHLLKMGELLDMKKKLESSISEKESQLVNIRDQILRIGR